MKLIDSPRNIVIVGSGEFTKVVSESEPLIRKLSDPL